MSGALNEAAVVVIGGGRGIGRAHALACAAAGARVLVNDLGCDVHGAGADPSIAVEVARAIAERGGQAIGDATDLAAPGGADRIVERALAEFGRLDAVLCAAGLIADRTVLKMDDAVLDRMIDVHVKGSFAITRAAARAMVDRGEGGSIVLHTAPVAFFGALRQSALSACSAAVTGLARAAAIELRKHRVRVNAIAPTARTRTTEDLPLFRGIAPDSMSPEACGPVGVFLASALSREVTGEIVGVAGTRVYAFRARETPGWFADGAIGTAEDVAKSWPQIVRP